MSSQITIHNHLIDKVAVATGIFSGFALYPQVYAIVSLGSTEGVSFITYGLIFINSVVWLMYSIHRGLFSLAIPSILNIIASGIVIVWSFMV